MANGHVEDGDLAGSWWGYLAWVVALICLLLLMLMLILRWRKKFPAPSPVTGASGSSGASGGSGVVVVTGPTGPTGVQGQTGVIGIPSFVTGPTGPTGLNFRVDQIGNLTDAVVTGIMLLPFNYGFGVAVDNRSSFTYPSTLFGDKTLHLLQWMPGMQPQWFDFGPWIGATGGTGPIGPTGVSAQGIGATGPVGLSARGPTGLTGPQGTPGTVGPFYGSLYGPGVVTNPPPAEDQITISTNTVLTSDLYARNLAITAGTLFTAGYRIFVQKNFVVTAPGSIDNSGFNGRDAAVAPGFPINTGGTGGVGGGFDQFLGGGYGADGTSDGTFRNGQSVRAGLYLPDQTFSDFYVAGDNTAQVPTGGAGGIVVPLTDEERLQQFSSAPRPIKFMPGIFVSGGSGGGSGSSTLNTVVAASGGGGGGVIGLFVGTFLPSNGLIRAVGGNGGNAVSTLDSPGSGGGGGVILVRSTTPKASILQSIFKVDGGLGGISQNSGASSPGKPGQVIFLSP